MTKEQIAYAYECAAARCRARGMKKADAEDMSQYILMRLASTFHRFNPRRASWRTYISRRVASLMVDAWRRWHGRPMDAISLDASDAPDIPARPSTSVEDALEEIPDQLAREIARLHWEGVACARIITLLGITDDEYNHSLSIIKDNLK